MKKCLLTAAVALAMLAAVPAHADQYVDLGYDARLGYGILVQFRDDGTSSVYWYDACGNWDALLNSLPPSVR